MPLLSVATIQGLTVAVGNHGGTPSVNDYAPIPASFEAMPGGKYYRFSSQSSIYSRNTNLFSRRFYPK